MAVRRTRIPKSVETLAHVDDTRVNIPTAEYEPVVDEDTRAAIRVAYERRNRDLDPQLVWRGKDGQDLTDLVVAAPPIYIQEKVQPKALIDDLMQRAGGSTPSDEQMDLFADFNGLEKGADRIDFYGHEQNWTNRMILGDSLHAMASLAEREGLRGKVQCIYIDPPYGIKFNSNFQWSTTTRDVKDGKTNHITREPEQVRAFRDTWRDGVHSYLTYLRDRLTLARELLSPTGSLFVQIGDENVHRVRALLDEIFGAENMLSMIPFTKTSGATSSQLAATCDYLLWYARSQAESVAKYRQLFVEVNPIPNSAERYVCVELPDLRGIVDLSVAQKENQALRPDGRILRLRPTDSQDETADSGRSVSWEGRDFFPPAGRHWTVTAEGMRRVVRSGRAHGVGRTLCWKYYREPNFHQITNDWKDLKKSGFGEPQRYVVETQAEVIQRCILMSTDPGDIVLDPTCGSGTTAMVAERWGRRWITMDTSRVALALARARIMAARFPYFLLADSAEGRGKEAELSGGVPRTGAALGSLRQGFVYERVPRVTLKSIADNAEIDAIDDRWGDELTESLGALNGELSEQWEEWEVPRDLRDGWSARARRLHEAWWRSRAARQEEMEASIASKVESQPLYDRPYEDGRKVRVAGPFTVESLSPHRYLGVDEDGGLIDPLAGETGEDASEQAFVRNILESLETAGVQQVHKDDRITFTSLIAWPGGWVCAEGRYLEGEVERRAGIFVGPEFGTVLRADLVKAAREAADAGFDVLIACAFSYEPHTTEFTKLGRLPVLKAGMNADLHMAEDLKNTGKGNLFVIFGEPDIDVLDADDGRIQVRINGVDVFDPTAGEVRSDTTDGIACWFVDTDYDEESFFVRHAYFLGADDPYKALRTTLRAEIDADAWATLNSDVSRPFPKPETGRIAVKVINHLGDEVMKVLRVD